MKALRIIFVVLGIVFTLQDLLLISAGRPPFGLIEIICFIIAFLIKPREAITPNTKTVLAGAKEKIKERELKTNTHALIIPVQKKIPIPTYYRANEQRKLLSDLQTLSVMFNDMEKKALLCCLMLIACSEGEPTLSDEYFIKSVTNSLGYQYTESLHHELTDTFMQPDRVERVFQTLAKLNPFQLGINIYKSLAHELIETGVMAVIIRRTVIAAEITEQIDNFKKPNNLTKAMDI